MSLAEMRAFATARGWPVEIEREPAGEGYELVRLWSMLDGEWVVSGRVAPAGDRTVLDDLAATFLIWWRSDE